MYRSIKTAHQGHGLGLILLSKVVVRSGTDNNHQIPTASILAVVSHVNLGYLVPTPSPFSNCSRRDPLGTSGKDFYRQKALSVTKITALTDRQRDRHTHRHLINGLFFRSTWVSRHRYS